MGSSLDRIKSQKAESAKFMEDEITHIIKNFEKRQPGSAGEKQAIDYMAEQLKEYGCDVVKVEPFKLNPGAFMGWIYISITLLLAAVALYFAGVVWSALWAQIVSLCLCGIGVFIFMGEFFLYKQIVDPFFREKTSHNITAIKKPAGEVKRRIFINGHPDAANEFRFHYHLGFTVYSLHFLLSLVGIIYFLAILIASMCGISHNIALIMGYVGLIFVPLWFGMYFMSDPKTPVDGANDNLTACYLGISLMKDLKEQGIELDHTEVGVLITGSEEAGLRGAKAWAKAHKGEYQDVDTYFFCFDTIREKDFLQVNMKDLNGRVPGSKEAADMFLNAAKKVGTKCGKGMVPFGGGATDSAALSQGGFKSVGITGMSHNLKKYYHTRDDSYDNLDLIALADCYEACVQMIEDSERA